MTAKKKDPATSPTSEAQVRANRANARKSTGPRTAEGKRRAALNAVRVGLFVNGDLPLNAGPFEENPVEFQQYLEVAVAALAPGNPLAYVVAQRVVRVSIALGRCDVAESALLETAGTFADVDIPFLGGDREQMMLRLSAAGDIIQWCMHHDKEPDPDEASTQWAYDEDRLGWSNMARLLGLEFGCRVVDLWDDTHTPASPAEWKRAFLALSKRCFPNSEDDLLTWAKQQRTKWGDKYDERVATEDEIVARRVTTTIDAHAKKRQRLLSEFERQLALFNQLNKFGGVDVIDDEDAD